MDRSSKHFPNEEWLQYFPQAPEAQSVAAPQEQTAERQWERTPEFSYNYVDELGNADGVDDNVVQADTLDEERQWPQNVNESPEQQLQNCKNFVYENNGNVYRVMGLDEDNSAQSSVGYSQVDDKDAHSVDIVDENVTENNTRMVPEVEGDLVGVFDSVDAESVAKMMLSEGEGGIIGVIGTDVLVQAMERPETTLKNSKFQEDKTVPELSLQNETGIPFDNPQQSLTVTTTSQGSKAANLRRDPLVITDEKGTILGYIVNDKREINSEVPDPVNEINKLQSPLQKITDLSLNFRNDPQLAQQHPTRNSNIAFPYPKASITAQNEGFDHKIGWPSSVSSENHNPPPEILVMQPLRTRKSSAPRALVVNSDLDNSMEKCNLETFEGKQISIPVINTKLKSKQNRQRKKIHTILKGRLCSLECISNINIDYECTDGQSAKVRELSGRKKKTSSSGECVSTHSKNRTKQSSSAKKLVSVQTPNGEPKIRAIKLLANICDSESNDDIEELKSEVGKSLKCDNCQKIFKSNRSMLIHKKSCANTEVVDVSPSRPQVESCISEGRSSNESTKLNESSGSQKNNRCVTRSQTKRAVQH